MLGTPSTRGSLRAPHQGYTFQDVVTAYHAALCVARQEGTVIANRKDYDSDKFDDVVTRNSSGVRRCQLKHSADPARPFEKEDLNTRRNRSRLDDLVRSHRDAPPASVGEYRCCASWAVPVDADLLTDFVLTADEPSFEGHPSRTYRMRPEVIWPQGGIPTWKSLIQDDITRDDWLAFAERFVIELECPAMSGDFERPGPLESLLIQVLERRIGVGRYPNHNLSPSHAAAALAWLASTARVEEATLGLTEIEFALGLLKDFGRVAQSFPVNTLVCLRREVLADDLRAVVAASSEQGQITTLIGPPGSGKSWTLDQLAVELRKEGHIVARHYCYLEPGDPEVQRRITTQTLFGNLIAELLEGAPVLRQKHFPIYAAGSRAAESASARRRSQCDGARRPHRGRA